MTDLSRRLFLGGTTAVAVCPSLAIGRARPVPVVNPLVLQRADAQIFRHTDGNYYMTASVPEYDRLILRRASTLSGLRAAKEVVVWRRPSSGRMAGYIWAPELHWIDGRWHIYFAAGDGDDKFRIRTYVLRCLGADAFTGRWEIMGMLETPWDTFTLDATCFVHRGTRYLCWAQHEPGIENNTSLLLAPLATPTTLARAPVRLTAPTYDWEVQGFKVNEAPALLARNGRLFLSYSASATDARYCLGLLTAPDDADIMDARAWSKSPTPVFVTSAATKVYGPGHNSFTVDEQGRDVLVYHGRDYEQIEGDPLFDPNRHTRVQRLYYHADGTPDFGIPIGNGPLPDRWSPLDRKDQFVRVEGDRVSVGTGPLATTQLRMLDGLAGASSIALAPIGSADTRLLADSDGAVRLARNDGSDAFARVSSFVKREGLADSDGISFASVSARSSYLRHVNGSLRVEAVRSAAARASATFLQS